MEQSKLISSTIAKLKVAYPFYFKDLKNEELVMLVKIYQDQLSKYSAEVLMNAIDKIISTFRFMPSVADIKGECENQISNYVLDILQIMLEDGYFKCGKELLRENQEIRNYDKARMWLNKGIAPKWLLEDMKKYGYKESILLLDCNEEKRIEKYE